jgi:anti-anti-sigma factor
MSPLSFPIITPVTEIQPATICSVTRAKAAGSVFVVLQGSLDEHLAARLHKVCADLLPKGLRWAYLDLDSVPFVSAAGINHLTDIANTLKEKSGGVVIVRPRPKVRVTFDMLTLDGWFHLVETLEEAEVWASRTAPPPARPKRHTVKLQKPAAQRNVTTESPKIDRANVPLPQFRTRPHTGESSAT